MRVVLLAPLPPPAGGIAGWTQRMTEVTLKNGWKVDVVDEKVIGGRSVFGGDSKKVLRLEIKRCFKIWYNLSVSLKNNNTKIVQSCIPAGVTSMMREVICALISKAHKKKFIIHFRCTLPNMIKTRTSKVLFMLLVKSSNCVFVLNKASYDFVKKNNPSKLCYIIPNFIESDAIQEKRYVNGDINSLIYVGGVIPEKGCDMIAAVARHFPEKSFRLIGKIGMDKSIFPKNVILLGELPKESVQEELNKADVFLFFSRFSGEGFSNALAEAMSHALPCIVSNWAANADMIENKGGIVLKKYSIKEAINAVYKLENATIRQRCGEWNVKKVLNEYIDSKVTSKYVDVYEELLR